MCSNTCQTIFFGLVAKDFVAPAVGLIGTLVIAAITYRGIFLKIQLDRQVKWIDEVRSEIASLSSILISYSNSAYDQREKINYSVSKIDLYLDLSKPLHKVLHKEMDAIVTHATIMDKAYKLNPDINMSRMEDTLIEHVETIKKIAKDIFRDELKEMKKHKSI